MRRRRWAKERKQERTRLLLKVMELDKQLAKKKQLKLEQTNQREEFGSARKQRDKHLE
jgi:hypothetical protein